MDGNIPNRNVESRLDENGHYQIHMEHKGFYNKLAQVFSNRPRFSWIEIQGQGNTVWRAIDGKNTVDDIADILREEYGKEAEPLPERLLAFLKILEHNKFIYYSDKRKEDDEKNGK